jgi:hypothetical protein
VCAVLAGLLLGGWVMFRPAPRPGPVRFVIPMPDGVSEPLVLKFNTAQIPMMFSGAPYKYDQGHFLPNVIATYSGDNAAFKDKVVTPKVRLFSKDEQKAAEWMQKAAEQGNAPAEYDLGALYQNGRGVPIDKVKAAHPMDILRTAVSASVALDESSDGAEPQFTLSRAR